MAIRSFLADVFSLQNPDVGGSGDPLGELRSDGLVVFAVDVLLESSLVSELFENDKGSWFLDILEVIVSEVALLLSSVLDEFENFWSGSLNALELDLDGSDNVNTFSHKDMCDIIINLFLPTT
jgi:hypothetical protein